MAKNFMSIEHLRAAWAYMKANAMSLMDRRPSDEEFAAELTKELGLKFTSWNAKSLRQTHNVMCPTEVMGEKVEIRVTWRVPHTPKKGRKRGGITPRTTMELTAQVDKMEPRLAAVEKLLHNVCRDLGVKIG